MRHLEGIFPEDCPNSNINLLPKDLCHNCNLKCSWNYDYLEAILSENGTPDTNLDFIFKDFINGVIDEKEAQEKIYKILPGKIKIQYALRSRALDPIYFAFYDSYEIEMEEI